MNWILIFSLLLLSFLFVMFCYCDSSKSNSLEGFSSSECTANIEAINNLSSVYNANNLIIGNLNLGKGQIFKGSIQQFYPNTLGLYSSESEAPINIYATNGTIDFYTDGGNNKNIWIGTDGSLNTGGTIYAEQICIGPVGSKNCISLTSNKSQLPSITTSTSEINGNLTTGILSSAETNATNFTMPQKSQLTILGPSGVTTLGSPQNNIPNMTANSWNVSTCTPYSICYL